jgi:transposase, IS5 family
VPDETTVLKFRHLLQEHDLGEKLFAEVGRAPQRSRFALKTGTIVDATQIGARRSIRQAARSGTGEFS